MKVKVNGTLETVKANLSLQGLLDDLKIEVSYAALAVNKNFIPRSRYKDYALQEGDAVELGTPMQGG